MGAMGNLADLLLPRNCILCRQSIHNTKGEICSKCLVNLPYLGGSDWYYGKNFSRCFSLFLYEGRIAEAIKAFKYRGKYHYAKTFGPMLARLISRQNEEFDIVTYVPQSLARTLERGYNHSRLLAAETVKSLGLEKPQRLLVKKKETDNQASLPAAARAENIRGSFRISKAARARGKRVLIIDDVLTTGSTLEECAGVLMSGGAASVACATLSRSKWT